MALSLLRVWNRPVSVLIRHFKSNPGLVNQSRRLAPAASAVRDVRQYSSEPGKQKVMLFVMTNPIIWFRNRIYFYLISTYFDKEFSIGEFMEGATQAFSHVSRMLSQCQFEALDGLVAKDLIKKLEEKCSNLPLSHQKALSALQDDILYMTARDVGIYYDDNERKFVSILIRFWYLTSARIPDESFPDEAVTVMAAVENKEMKRETKRLLTANYEFQREFTDGVTPDWTITRIEHSKLID